MRVGAGHFVAGQVGGFGGVHVGVCAGGYDYFCGSDRFYFGSRGDSSRFLCVFAVVFVCVVIIDYINLSTHQSHVYCGSCGCSFGFNCGHLCALLFIKN